MTIFGFNTDVKHGDTVYHVQSEARQSDLLVQTLVFVKGLCVGKRATSYAGKAAAPDFSDQAIHELLKAQHRAVVDAINAGNMESALGTAGDIQDIGGAGLSLNWIKSEPVIGQSSISMHFQVTDSGHVVAGAEVVARLGSAGDAPVIGRAKSDSAGNLQMQITMTDELKREAAITVQAIHGGKSATRKFRLKRADA